MEGELGNHSEAGPEQTGVAILCCCPICLTAFMGMSESVSVSIFYFPREDWVYYGLSFFFWSREGLSKNSVFDVGVRGF